MSTTAPTREDIATRALLEPEEKTIGGLVLRPVSLGSLSLLRVTRNEFLTPAGPERLNPLTGLMEGTLENEIFATMAFAYIHGAPLPEVRRYVWNLDVFREKVVEWGMTIPAEAMPALIPQILRTLESIQALEFAVQPKPAKPGEKNDEPPNS